MFPSKPLEDAQRQKLNKNSSMPDETDFAKLRAQ